MDDQRVAVITGASSGIGLETAKALVKADWRVIAIGRDRERSQTGLAEIRGTSEGGAVEMLLCDLSVMSDVARLASTISERTPYIDVLINNAGGTCRERVLTSEGNEATFAGNYLGHFLLTNRLLPLLRRAAETRPKGSTRVLNVSSMAHEASEGLDWTDLQSVRNFSAERAYNNAKLANLLHTRALAKRLEPLGIVAHCMHPGIVATNFVNHGNEAMKKVFDDYADIVVPAADGADTLIWLAVAEEPGRTTGGYFFAQAPAPVSAIGEDQAAAERLWRESEVLTTGAEPN